MIRVQEDDFDVAAEYQALVEENESGAIVTFIGRVRDFDTGDGSKGFYLEHYPGMTESVLQDIENTAKSKWSLLNTCIIHRVGNLGINDQIVFVGASSAHRQDAFAACHYMIDILKTQAPFWKKEGKQWVEAKQSDQEAADAWLTKQNK